MYIAESSLSHWPNNKCDNGLIRHFAKHIHFMHFIYNATKSMILLIPADISRVLYTKLY